MITSIFYVSKQRPQILAKGMGVENLPSTGKAKNEKFLTSRSLLQ